MLRPIENDNINGSCGSGAQSAPPLLQPAAPPVEKKLDIKTPPKKSLIKRIFTDIFNGLVICLCVFAAAGMLIESYMATPRPALAWLAFIPFAIAIVNVRGSVYSFLISSAIGMFSYMGIIYWIMPTVQSGTSNDGLAAASVMALSAILALQFGLFGILCNYLKRVRWAFPFTAACAWVALEFAHQLIAYKFMAFPWFALGYTQANIPEIIQISSYTGVYGISFLIVFTGFAFAAAFNSKMTTVLRTAYFVLPLIFVSGAYMWGKDSISRHNAFFNNSPAKIAIAVMQPDTHAMLFSGYSEDVVYTIYDQALALDGKKTDLIIWPESSFPGMFTEGSYKQFMQELSLRQHAWQITGSTTEINGKDYVSAGLFDDTGALRGVYNKVKLVPFGEFLPFKSLFGGLYESHNISSFTGDFKEGDQPGRVFEITLQDSAGQDKTYLFGTTICFESLFPPIWRKQSVSGAQFFVNISNDGWFLSLAAQRQHLRAVILRAAENRRPVIRGANTGISAWIDAFGRVNFQTQADKQETAIFNFTFQPKAGKTFYSRNGDVFALFCSLAAITFLIFSIAFLSAVAYDRD